MALKLEKDSADKLKTMGVKVVENVDKTGFMKAAAPVQDQLAAELGPHAVKLLKMVREREVARRSCPAAAAKSRPSFPCLSDKLPMADFRALILQRHRHLKWKAFDWLEAMLMILCGVCIAMFTLAVFCDVRHAHDRRAVAVAAAGDDRVLRLGRLHRHGGGDAPQRPLLSDRDHQADDRRAAHA